MIKLVNITDVKTNKDNPRTISDDKFNKLVKSIKEFPKMLEIRPIVVDSDMIVLGGNMRLKACKEAGLKEIHIIKADDLTEEQKKEFIIKDNVGFGEWDWQDLKDNWEEDDLIEWGMDIPEFFEEEEEESENDLDPKSLSDKFIIPPFSILDTRQGYWQNRKREWKTLNIKSELGRKDDLMGDSKETEGNWGTINGKKMTIAPNTSIFDPVLCEIIYKWFCVDSGVILDPFAGGSVRGIVAGKLKYNYIGNDLRKEQIEANRLNAEEVLLGADNMPTWTIGDSLKINTLTSNAEVDLVFSCPPYADLEVYSDLKEDISNMPYGEFMDIYKEIIYNSCKQLKNDRFAVFVVGDVRDKKGLYQNFIAHTKEAFINAGLKLYNELILVEQSGTAALRAGKTFTAGRKVVKTHQNVLVFFKGDPKTIKNNYKEIEVMEIEEEEYEV